MDREITTRPETQITHTRGGRQSLPPIVFFLGYWCQWEQETVSHPECEKFESQAVSPSFNGDVEFKPRFCRGLQMGKVAQICDLWFALSAKVSWSKITNGKENYRVLPRQNLEANGTVGVNLRPFSFSASVEPLYWTAQRVSAAREA